MWPKPGACWRCWSNGYTIADIAIFPWVRNLIGFYGAGDTQSLLN